MAGVRMPHAADVATNTGLTEIRKFERRRIMKEATASTKTPKNPDWRIVEMRHDGFMCRRCGSSAHESRWGSYFVCDNPGCECQHADWVYLD